ncbi:MAG TPA: response regulator, partial [Lachnospiraceae bacterium]|nr:response regulator [Lachnospiraceae bacterium]
MQKISILLAEDEEDIRNLLSRELSDEGYTIYTASDGVEAYSLFQMEKIDIAIFDSMMPRLDGVSLMRKIREQSDMPIIFLTARDTEMDKVLALSLGADDYMVKPFSIAELKARI